MPKVKISEYSATAADNTDINGIDIAEGCAPSGINDAIRTLMKQIKDLQAGTSGDTIPVTAGGTGSTTAGAARTALGATTTGNSLFTAVDAAAARTAIGAGTGTGDVTTTGSQVLTNKTIAYADNTLTGVAGVTATQTLTNKTLTDPAIIGTILEDIFTITDGAAFEIDPGNGSIQLITLGASRTPKATNFANGESVVLMVDDGSAYTLTWTDATFGGSGVVWKTNAGAAPTLNTTGYTVIVLWEVAGQVYGARVGDA
jgi:hypothetical protein